LIVKPLAALAPEVPDSETVHEKPAPVGVELNAIEGDVAEQIVWVVGVAATTGVGFTVIGMSIGNPTQPNKVGVTV
jgi:hypothetical protein